MKKNIFIIIVATALSLTMQAQTPTTHDTVYNRDNHYHWSEWYDTLEAFNNGMTYYNATTGYGSIYSYENRCYISNYHWTDRPIPIKGLACGLLQPIDMIREHASWVDTPGLVLPPVLPEYLILGQPTEIRIYPPALPPDYVVDSSDHGDWIYPIDSVRWDTANYRVMMLPNNIDPSRGASPVYVYEAYFKSPIWVDTDFYTIATHNNLIKRKVYNEVTHDSVLWNPYRTHYAVKQFNFEYGSDGRLIDYGNYFVKHGQRQYYPYYTAPYGGYYTGSSGTAICFFPIVDFKEVRVESEDSAMGSATGSGLYYEGEQVTIAAVASTGFHFLQWSDGVTDNPRTVTVHWDSCFVAEFEREQDWYYVRTAVNNPDWGYATGDSLYHYGDQATVTATAYYNCAFECWSDSVWDNPRTITVTSDTLLTALFSSNVGIGTTDIAAFSLRPNPTRDRLTVERPDAGPATLEVFNAKGQKVLVQTSDQAVVTLDVSSLSAGSYLLRVTTAEGSAVRSFVVGR